MDKKSLIYSKNFSKDIEFFDTIFIKKNFKSTKFKDKKHK